MTRTKLIVALRNSANIVVFEKEHEHVLHPHAVWCKAAESSEIMFPRRNFGAGLNE